MQQIFKTAIHILQIREHCYISKEFGNTYVVLRNNKQILCWLAYFILFSQKWYKAVPQRQDRNC